MALIKTVKPEDATGVVKEAYDFMQQRAGLVPMPMQMMSVSPPMMSTMMSSMQHFMQHPNLDPVLLTQIRLMTADRCDYPYCVMFNTNILKQAAGFTDEQVAAFMSDPASVASSDKNKAMLGFVQKAMKDPDAVEQADVDALHELGWTDQDIFDATAHASNMVSAGILYRTFKIGE